MSKELLEAASTVATLKKIADAAKRVRDEAQVALRKANDAFNCASGDHCRKHLEWSEAKDKLAQIAETLDAGISALHTERHETFDGAGEKA